MTVIFWVSSDVLENERTRGRDDQDLEHEIVECFEKDLAESLGLEWLSIIVSKVLCPLWEGAAVKALCEVHFKLVTDAFNAYLPRKIAVMTLKAVERDQR